MSATLTAVLIGGSTYTVVTIMGLIAGLAEMGEPALTRRARGAHMVLTCWAWPWKLLQQLPALFRDLRDLNTIYHGRG